MLLFLLNIWLAPSFYPGEVFIRGPEGAVVVGQSQERVIFEGVMPSDGLRWEVDWVRGIGRGEHEAVYIVSLGGEADTINLTLSIEETGARVARRRLGTSLATCGTAGFLGGCLYAYLYYCPNEYGDDTTNLYECQQTGCAVMGLLGGILGASLPLLVALPFKDKFEGPEYLIRQEVR